MSEPLLRTDEELLQSYGQFAKMIYRLCFTYLKNTADTEDMVQSVFVKRMTCGKKFDNREHEKAWLIVTASNLCKNYLRHWWRKREELSENLQGAPVEFETNEVLDSILALPEKYRVVIYLYYYEGYQCTKISHMLHKPSSTVRNHLSEARKLLRELLGGELE